jgi:molybdopterin-guanine dinucleotide biosynthesis protein A
MQEVTAFVLAGGKSTRMGSDKAFLDLAGRPLLLRALDVARSVTSLVKIVGDPEKFGVFGPVIPDIYRDRGPLAGIHAALADTETDWNFILAVDIPFLSPAFLRYLVLEAQSSGATVTVPGIGKYFHPLCAVYRKQFGTLAELSLKTGRNKIDGLFPQIDLRVIDEDELRHAGFSAAIFRNVNTPEDWEKTKKELEIYRDSP